MKSEALLDEDFDFYQSRIRILLILYFFSVPYQSKKYVNRKTLFETEVRIQKIDFLIRNPDYLAYEMLSLVKEGGIDDKKEVKHIVDNIFLDKEPLIRKNEMERFFFGAYEDLDDVIAFLKAFDFIEYESGKNVAGQIFGKKYYVTSNGAERIEKGVKEISSISWYEKRCKLIKKYFGELSGSELKVRQYQIEKYRDTPLNQYIESVIDETKKMYIDLYGEELA
tara:strand:- start:3956 stop:4627 length:672 start_codon:yes stop_codon:yes gene_type:complete